ADDSQDAADSGADQPLQAHRAQPHLEDDDAGADSHPGSGGGVGAQPEGMEDVAGYGYDQDKKHTNESQVHRGTSLLDPLWRPLVVAPRRLRTSSARTVPYCSSRSV